MQTVSIIIPVYNGEVFLERAVQSALVQVNVKEIIIVDDGSTDNSLLIGQQLAQLSPKIQVYTHPEKINKGLAATRNRALEFCTGAWIQLLDADDELMLGKISSQLEYAKPDTPFIVGNAIDQFSDGRTYQRKFKKSAWIALMSGKLGISSANLFNRKYIDLVGGFDSSLRTSEEYDLMFRIMKNGWLPVYDSKFLTRIHVVNSSLSRGKRNNHLMVKNWIDLRKKIRGFLISKGEFGLLHSYHYSGAVGSFMDRYKLPFDGTINPTLFKVYSLEKNIKSKIFKRLYFK
ncbi:glycosyltransferase family 2 protein [Algoriphagus sp. AGSA1]|uniref:glycosyltransferase family 2 protein n=1 Tax=Algoriphagus sp. AGSA1 TaxID=2907213 RepID=UPI001F1F4FFE|nr:glycosyltransferase family 2 protein [Algoriphagus sp. AGSA1]MCE7054123.1 glycosyltransferase family 2 protein [Algoriphagus sp. AGSA1]